MSRGDRYEAVIGLEVHAQLLTKSKAFCACPTTFGDPPNSNTCPVCLGMPGSLPVLNKQAVEFAVRLGLATNSSIASRSIFARKNYFYPDLPKGYQISQYDQPICSGGWVEIEFKDGSQKKIGLTRIHIEEDAGKSLHENSDGTLVDANRCGVPLLEIVSEPDLRSAHEAYLYMRAVRQLVTYLGICDGTMEEGSLRCDANVSVRRVGETKLGTKTEVKNVNSFRFVEKAIDFEVSRQTALLEAGEAVVQQTMLWDADRGECIPMRTKEEAHDYRYFPDPDLLPVDVDEPWIARTRSSLPELPAVRRTRYVQELHLPPYDAAVLTSERSVAEYFDAIVNGLPKKEKDSFKLASNWIMTDVLRVANDRNIDVRDFPVSPAAMSEMIGLIVDGTISGKIAKQVFEEMLSTRDLPKAIVQKHGWMQVSDEGVIEKTVDEILAKNKVQVQEFQSGKESVFGFFVGETMKAMKGKANPRIVNEMLRKKLGTG